MKIIRYLDPTQTARFGQLREDGSVERLEGELFGELEPSGEMINPEKLLAPVVPTQVLAIGLNYRRHAEETNAQIPEYPVQFTKSIGSVQNPEDPILLPRHLRSDEVDYECELAVVIGKPCKNVSKDRALDFVFGYTCANDVSARDWQKRRSGGQWSRAKSFDTFCPLGPCLVTRDEIPEPNNLQISTRVNGEILQDWNTHDMIFDIPTLIEFLSGSTTLPAGTVILTGTPHGVGMARTPPRWLQPGDVVRVEIERIGILENPVEEEIL